MSSSQVKDIDFYKSKINSKLSKIAAEKVDSLYSSKWVKNFKQSIVEDEIIFNKIEDSSLPQIGPKEKFKSKFFL